MLSLVLSLGLASGGTLPVATESIEDENGLIYTDSTKTEIIGFNKAVFNGELVIPESVTTIKGNAFVDCTFKGELRIPPTVKLIESGAFTRIEAERVTIESDGMSCSSGAFDTGNVTNISIKGNDFKMGNSGIFESFDHLTLCEISGANHKLGGLFEYCGNNATTRVVVDCENGYVEGSCIFVRNSLIKELEIRGRNFTLDTDGSTVGPFEGSRIETIKISAKEVRIRRSWQQRIRFYGSMVFEDASFSELVRSCFISAKCSGTWTFADDLKRIESEIFSGQGEMVKGEIVIPSGVSSIYYNAFASCWDITAFRITGSTIFIEMDGVILRHDKVVIGLFPRGKTGTFNIPSTVVNLVNYDGARTNYHFTHNSLSEFTVDTGSVLYSAEEGILYNKAKTHLIACPRMLNREELILPNSVTDIIGYAFYYCQGIKSIVFPTGLKTIDGSSFTRFKGENWELSLDSVVVKSSSFSRCLGLKSLHIRNSQILTYAFSGSSLTSVTIETTTDLPDSCFTSSSQLTSVKIQAINCTVGYRCFDNCMSLAEVFINGTNMKTDEPFHLCQIGNLTIIGENNQLNNALVRGGHIEVLSLSRCTSLQIMRNVLRSSEVGLVLLEDTSFSYIYAESFKGIKCQGRISFTSNVTTIATGWFSGSQGIYGEVVFDGPITDISADAFDGCPLITGFKITKANNLYVSYDGVVYEKRERIIQVVLWPDGKTGNLALYPTLSLITITPEVFFNKSFSSFNYDGQTDIAVYHGYGLDGTLVAVAPKAKGVLHVRENVITIGRYACAYNDGLTSIILGANVERINERAFEGCQTLTGVFVIPSCVKYISEYAFAWCNGGRTLEIIGDYLEICHLAFVDASFTELILSGKRITTNSWSLSRLEKLKTLRINGTFIELCPTSVSYLSPPAHEMDVFIDGTSVHIESGAFDKCNIGQFVHGSTSSKIAAGIFHDSVVNRIEIGGEFLEIYGPMENETRIGSVYLNSPSIHSIAAYVFANVAYSGTARFEQGIERIGQRAFAVSNTVTGSASSLDVLGLSGYIQFPITLAYVEEGAFENCAGITHVAFWASNGVTLESSAFGHCTGIIGVWSNSGTFLGSNGFPGIDPEFHYYAEPPLVPPEPVEPVITDHPSVPDVTERPEAGEKGTSTSHTLDDDPDNKTGLKVGLGVGLSLLVVIVVVVVVIVVLRKRGKRNHSVGTSSESVSDSLGAVKEQDI